MKKTQEILGLPIISISDGLEVGKVKSIIINADKGSIEYIVVDNGIQILSARVIPTDSILGVGEYAVTIENDSSINDISKIPAAIDLLQKNIQVKGTKVLTKKGRLIGEIGDFYVDENECCKITGLEYIADITQKRIRLIPRESVLTFGKNLIVVIEEVECTLVDRSTQLGSGENQTEAEKKNLECFNSSISVSSDEIDSKDKEIQAETIEDTVSFTDSLTGSEGSLINGNIETPKDNADIINQDVIINESEILSLGNTTEIKVENELFKINNTDEIVTLNNDEDDGSIKDAIEAASTDDSSPVTEINAASLFEQRQKQYLNGRRSTKTIADNFGNVIISEGMVINHDIIDVAKNAGKLIELVMNNKA
jgi:uncharacterized protein YrrD